ncbi:hypothetical protein [Sphingomonas glaciei]|uniref:Uncharacterized protein n=1 Tax=Sphingomonas glaciei TaxID=2938948 RepID=A0ABY5MZ19_9SPHN|nr:hypothetical protein [Sphingomonas glaciei]UUR08552.1 hypothetical protein M1K48_02615 [Sphingomonas glaciei]
MLAAVTAFQSPQATGKVALTAEICEDDEKRRQFFAQPGGPPMLKPSPDILTRRRAIELRVALFQQRATLSESESADLYLELLKRPPVTAAGRAMVALVNEVSDHFSAARKTGDERKMCLATLEKFVRLPELENLQRQLFDVQERELGAMALQRGVSLEP